MKKRVLALFLALIMMITLAPLNNASAAVNNTTYGVDTTDVESPVSMWSMNDLLTGISYGIYPTSWNNMDMTVPITQGKLRTLIGGTRVKILETECVTEFTEPTIRLKTYSTVEKVLNTFYNVLSNYKFTKDIGLSGKASNEFMKEAGIYTGANGEPALSDTCTIEEACVYATRLITYVYDKLDAASKGFFWVTKSGNNTVYMLGSVHVASNEVYPMSKKILDAYQSSEALIEEINIADTVGATKLAELGVYTDGTSLKEHVSAETYQKVVTFAAKYGLTEAIVSMLKPWYLYISFASLAYSETGDASDAQQAALLGIDMNFLNNAILSGKPVKEVEGYVYQGTVLDSFSDDLEEFLLNNTIDEVNKAASGKENDSTKFLETSLDLWHEGDVDTFLKLAVEEDEYSELNKEASNAKEAELYKEFEEKLIIQRDKGMADYIDNLLKSEGSHTYFVIVGSLHYISEYSVLDRLKDKGYEITQIK